MGIVLGGDVVRILAGEGNVGRAGLRVGFAERRVGGGGEDGASPGCQAGAAWCAIPAGLTHARVGLVLIAQNYLSPPSAKGFL